MTRTVVTSRVGPDGVLVVSVPLGLADANREVTVTVEPTVRRPLTPEEHAAFLDSIYGAWEGEFVRESEGSFEVREEFP